MRKTVFILISMVFTLCMAFPAAAFDVGIRGQYWFPDLSGDIRVDDNGLSGTSLDLEDDLEVDDESYPLVEVFAGLGNHHLSVAYYNADYEGSNVLDRTITFDGDTFNVGERVKSSLEYDVYDVMYRYDLLDLENVLAGFSLGLVGRVQVFDGSVEIDSPSMSTRQDFTAPIPMAGLNLHLGILADLLEARVLATGIGYGKGSMIDAQADISFTPFPFIDIHGGYRAMVIDFETDDVELNYDVLGPYVGVTLSF